MREWAVTITDDDVRFVETARHDYRVLAEKLEQPGATPAEVRAAGYMRAQEFYAERFLSRLTGKEES